MATSAQTMLTNLEMRLHDVADVPQATYLYWCDKLNLYAYRKLSQVDPSRFLTTQTYTVSVDPTTSALPAGFRDIQAKDAGFFKMDSTGNWAVSKLSEVGFGSNLEGYRLDGTNVIFSGIGATTTIKLRYVPTISTIDGLDDNFILPDEYVQYIEEALVKLYMEWDEDPDNESLTDQRLANLMDDMFTTIRRTPSIMSTSGNSTFF